MQSDPEHNLPSLEELSRYSWALADDCCAPGLDCLGIHKIWTTLRWLLHDGRLPAGSAFLAQRVKAIAARNASEILIAGGADTGLLEIIADACRHLDFQPRVTFVDRCATPCRQNRVLGDRLPFPVVVHQQDLLEPDAGPFDLIVAHNLMTFFSAEERKRLIGRWYELARPGAELAIIQSLELDENTRWSTRDKASVEPAITRLADAAEKAGFSQAEIDPLCSLARQLLMRDPLPAIHRNSLLDDLQAAGFRVDACEPLPPGRDNASGPRGTLGAGRYGLSCSVA